MSTTLLTSASSFVPSPMQQGFFDWVVDGAGSALLVAVAGAGKTTTVMQGFRRMRGRVIYLVFNKKNADEAKAKVAADPELSVRGGDPKSLDALFVSTFHSAGFKALRWSLGRKHALNVSKNKLDDILDAIVAGGPGREPRYDLLPLVPAVKDIVSMAKNRGIGALTRMEDQQAWLDMIDHYGLDENLPEDARMDQVVAFAQAVLRRSNADLETIDMDDMVYLPVLLKLRMFKHDWVVIDESQDANAVRIALAGMLLGPSGRLVAVGDPRQAIYGFTGADNDAMAKIASMHRAVELPLTVTYRCPKAVVAHAQQWVSHIEAHESAPEGSVAELAYADLFTTARAGDAILCRYNRHLVTACFKFIRAGVAAKIEGRSIGEGLVKLATRWKSVKRLPALRARLDEFLARETAKALAKKDEEKADRITDQVETLRVLIDRAEEQKADTVEALAVLIRTMFEDDVGQRSDVVVLASAHRSKGLEWDRVFILGRSQFMPARFAEPGSWQMEQEVNLIYVAVTRAKRDLVEVVGVPA